MEFDAAGTLQPIQCVNRVTLTLAGTAGAYTSSPELDQHSGSDGFRHYCDIAGNVARQHMILRKEKGQWRVDDLIAPGFETGLKQALRETIAEDEKLQR